MAQQAPSVLQNYRNTWMEETVDACKDVAMTISEIVIKGS